MRGPFVIAGAANVPLARAVALALGRPSCATTSERYPGGELHVEIDEDVSGADVFIVQSLAEPIERALLEAVLFGDAARRAGAARVNAVIPYLGYGRQDRRSGRAVPVGAAVVADIIDTARFDRVVLLDLHDPATEGFFHSTVAHLSAFAHMVAAIRPRIATGSVVVSPDLGAVRLARHYADELGLPVAVAHKTRTSGADVVGTGLTGDVRGLRPVIVDDMVTTGGTVAAAMAQLRSAGASPGATVAAVHGVFEPGCLERLRDCGVERILVSDSVALPADLPGWVEVVSVAPLLAEAARRLHAGTGLADLLSTA